MPKTLLITTLTLTLLFHAHFPNCNAVSVSGLHSPEKSDIEILGKRVCTKKVGDCFPDSEMEMDSESSRRLLLMQKKYISYETLKRDMVPCARPGASYYDCHPGQANSYSRGCEVITRCARGIRDTKT